MLKSNGLLPKSIICVSYRVLYRLSQINNFFLTVLVLQICALPFTGWFLNLSFKIYMKLLKYYEEGYIIIYDNVNIIQEFPIYEIFRLKNNKQNLKRRTKL